LIEKFTARRKPCAAHDYLSIQRASLKCFILCGWDLSFEEIPALL